MIAEWAKQLRHLSFGCIEQRPHWPGPCEREHVTAKALRMLSDEMTLHAAEQEAMPELFAQDAIDAMSERIEELETALDIARSQSANWQDEAARLKREVKALRRRMNT